MVSQQTETDRTARIDAFFLAPTKRTPDGDKSVLYLVRRELQDCLIGKVVSERRFLAQERRRRLFASAMVTFSGIDLLARLVSDARPRERFVRFLLRFGKSEDRSLTPPEADILWAYRNALMHSFGLHHIENGKRVPLWLFQQTDRAPVVHKCQLANGGHGWELSLDDLVEMFLLAVQEYEAALRADATLQEAFFSAVDTYGTIHHRGVHIARRSKTAE